MREVEGLKIIGYFASLDEPRVEGRTKHKLVEIITVALLAVICGAGNWVEVVAYGKSKEKWLKTFLELPWGIPSHDTFGRVFSLIDPKCFEACYRAWVSGLPSACGARCIALDGKTLRGSGSKKHQALHLISAWCVEDHLVLAQVPTEEHSNEISALPELLDVLDLKGAVVTVDAMGTQKEIARKILEKGGEYLLPVKGNQPRLHEDLALYFEQARAGSLDTWETTEKGHGRVEWRRTSATSDTAWLRRQGQWPQVNTIACVRSERTVEGQDTSQTRYYLVSGYASARRLGQLARAHWGIENHLHWSLDVAFDEDSCRVRKDHAPENLALLRRVALRALHQEKRSKRSLIAKRLSAGWDNNYLLKVLKAF